jgi:hypothetical protein
LIVALAIDRGQVAQLVEHTTENRSVDSSILSLATTFLNSGSQKLKIESEKSEVEREKASEPLRRFGGPLPTIAPAPTYRESVWTAHNRLRREVPDG